MIWHKFEDIPPPNDDKPKLIVWYQGISKVKHLAVAWHSLDELTLCHGFQPGDVMRYWTELTDPEEQYANTKTAEASG